MYINKEVNVYNCIRLDIIKPAAFYVTAGFCF